jgi:hypothetical protein
MWIDLTLDAALRFLPIWLKNGKGIWIVRRVPVSYLCTPVRLAEIRVGASAGN